VALYFDVTLLTLPTFHLHTHAHARTHVTHAHTHTPPHTRTQTNTLTHTHTRARTPVHTHTITHTCALTCFCFSSFAARPRSFRDGVFTRSLHTANDKLKAVPLTVLFVCRNRESPDSTDERSRTQLPHGPTRAARLPGPRGYPGHEAYRQLMARPICGSLSIQQ
jgi:hypothetical protein